jgi:ribosomal protein S18 acetylase RimI-like enzyme
MTIPVMNFREEVQPGDIQDVREILESTGFFFPYEVEVALELVQDGLNKGQASDYHFIFAPDNDRPVAFASYGPIACTKSSYDLYWIAVHQKARGKGIGKKVLEIVENRIAAMGGTRIYVETSSREQYAPTRSFYENTKYLNEAVLKDFYGPGDSKVIYVKEI